MQNSFDTGVSEWFLDHISNNSVILWISKYLSEYNRWGQMWIVFLVGFLIFESVKSRKFRFYFLVSSLLVTLVWLLSEQVLKPLVGRSRPWTAISDFVTVADSVSYRLSTTASFPSGHSCFSFGAATVIALKYRKLSVPAFLLAACVAFSRIVLGEHYLTDVLVGTLFGIGGGLLGYFAGKKLSSLIETKVYKNKPEN